MLSRYVRAILKTTERRCRVVAIAFGSCFSPVPVLFSAAASRKPFGVMSSLRSRACVNADRSRISDALQRRERQRSGLPACTHAHLPAKCASHCARVSTRTLPAACADPLDGDRSSLVCACAPIANVSVIATMRAVCISASPVFLRLRARSTVNRRADEERRELLRCTGRPSTLFHTSRKATVLPEKDSRSENVLPFFFRIWPP
jgi:hypothetical protein